MQMHAHIPQKGFRLLEGPVFVAGEDAMLDQIGGVIDMIEIFADPVEGLQVAQAALAFLDVGLDQIAAFALARMALVALGQLGFDKVAAVAGGDLGPEFLAQLFVERLVAPQIARLQDGGADGDVLLGQPHAFGQAAGGVADLQPQIPQHVEDEFDDAFAPGGLLEGAHEQKIDVRAGRQLAAAIAAGRHHGDAFGAGRVLGVIDMLGGEVVDHLDDGVLQPRQGARRGQAGQAFLLHRVLHLLAAFQEGGLDQGQARLAQGAGIAGLLGQRGQGMAQGVGVDQFAQGSDCGFSSPMVAGYVMAVPGLPPAGLRRSMRLFVPWLWARRCA